MAVQHRGLRSITNKIQWLWNTFGIQWLMLKYLRSPPSVRNISANQMLWVPPISHRGARIDVFFWGSSLLEYAELYTPAQNPDLRENDRCNPINDVHGLDSYLQNIMVVKTHTMAGWWSSDAVVGIGHVLGLRACPVRHATQWVAKKRLRCPAYRNTRRRYPVPLPGTAVNRNRRTVWTW